MGIGAPEPSCVYLIRLGPSVGALKENFLQTALYSSIAKPGGRSGVITEELRIIGHPHIVDLIGGMEAWLEAGKDVAFGEPVSLPQKASFRLISTAKIPNENRRHASLEVDQGAFRG